MQNEPKPKILIVDIETRPTVAYIWRLFKENVGLNQIIDPGGMICFAAKWVGNREMHFHADWTEGGHQAMVRAAHALISEADAVVTYNGDKFDIPKLTGEFLTAGLAPPPPVTSIDVYKTVRYKFGLLSNRLAFVGPFLKVGAKIKHEGFELWSKVNEGDERARAKMTKYCKQDVNLLERVYLKIRPYIRNHPHMGKIGSTACGACGSHKVQSRGIRRTRAMQIQRLHCQNCGAWFDGKKKRVP